MSVPIDEAEWPLVRVRWDGPMTDAKIDAFLAKMDDWLQRGQRFALLIDSRGARGMSPEQRARVIGHMKQNASGTAKQLVQAIVLDSLMQRTLFYGVNLIFRNPFPSKVFGDPRQAEAWLRSELASLPPASAP